MSLLDGFNLCTPKKLKPLGLHYRFCCFSRFFLSAREDGDASSTTAKGFLECRFFCPFNFRVSWRSLECRLTCFTIYGLYIFLVLCWSLVISFFVPCSTFWFSKLVLFLNAFILGSLFHSITLFKFFVYV